MNKLRRVGAHKIIGAYLFGLMIWFFVVSRSSWDWLGFWVFVLFVVSIALLLLVHFGNVGSTWNDKE